MSYRFEPLGDVMDLKSRLRGIVNGGAPSASPVDAVQPRRELTYEPDTGRYEATIDVDRIADVLGGHVVENRYGRALVVERRYESDRFHGRRRVVGARDQQIGRASCRERV